MNDISPREVGELYARITAELNKVIVGQEQIVRLLLASLFARGHCLLIGVPGLAKTLIVRTLAEILHLSFKRIQFTPDLMPSDIIGSELLQEHDRRLEYDYKPGPVFRSTRSRSAASRARCRIRSWWWRRRTPSSRRELIHCLKRSSTASCSR